MKCIIVLGLHNVLILWVKITEHENALFTGAVADVILYITTTYLPTPARLTDLNLIQWVLSHLQTCTFYVAALTTNLDVPDMQSRPACRRTKHI